MQQPEDVEFVDFADNIAIIVTAQNDTILMNSAETRHQRVASG